MGSTASFAGFSLDKKVEGPDPAVLEAGPTKGRQMSTPQEATPHPSTSGTDHPEGVRPFFVFS